MAQCKETSCNEGDTGDMCLIPGLGKTPGGGNGSPLQYCCWKTPWTEEPVWLWSMGSQESDMSKVTEHCIC